MAAILVVDDQPDLLDMIGYVLKTAGHHVLKARHGAEAIEILQSQPVDLIIADIAMPRLNGYQLYQQIREHPQWVAIPFIFLTARTLDSDIRYGKELGVDDYLTKPIEPEDLLAAVLGRLRRAHQLAQLAAPPAPAGPAAQGLRRLGRLQIDPGQHRTWFDGQPVELSGKEFLLLDYLAQRVGTVVPPRELIQLTHKIDTSTAEAGSLLRPLIRSVRRKLGYRVGEEGCIENVRGVGYRLILSDDNEPSGGPAHS